MSLVLGSTGIFGLTVEETIFFFVPAMTQGVD